MNDGEVGFFSQFVILALEDSWFSSNVDRKKQVLSSMRGHGDVRSHIYLSLGFKSNADMIIWRLSRKPEELQSEHIEFRKNIAGLGKIIAIYTGISRPSTYTGKEGEFEALSDPKKRSRYLSIYPFTKTPEWYLLDVDKRRKIMVEHIAIGRKFPKVRQVLLYSFGADDQEFVVAYETDDLKYYIECVMSLRESESRLYTKVDTPVFTGTILDETNEHLIL